MIAVLSPSCPEGVVEELRRRLADRGWISEVSRGREQTLLVVAGPASRDELSAALPADLEADVIALESRKAYAKRRRRRRTTHALVGGLGVLIALGLGIPALLFLRAPGDVLAASEFASVAQLARFEERSSRTVRVDGRPILLVRLDGRRLFALSAVCTYADDCLLEWSDERQQIVCPCDGGVYDLYGNVVEGPPSVPLRSFEIDVLGEDVRVRRGG